MKNLLFIFICCFPFYSHGNTQKQIYWFTYNEVDTYKNIPSQIKPISTVADTTRLLMQHLKNYQFTVEFAKSPTITRLVNKLPNSCAPNRVKTPERMTMGIFSQPLNIALDLRVYYKKGKQSFPENVLNENNRLASLSSLFTGKALLTLGVDSGRSLGNFLDKQVTALEPHNLVVRTGGGSTRALVEMLLKDRIDYIVDYPYSVNEALNFHSKKGALESIEIEGSPGYVLGYVVCNRSVEGQAIINDINRALVKIYQSYEFYQAHSRYLESSDILHFNETYQEVFNVDIPLAPENRE